MRQVRITERKTARTEGLMKYLNDDQSIPQISAQEEYEIAVEAAAGNSKAADKLALSNLRFVISVAKMYAGNNASRLEDLINEGNRGLVEASKQFDPTTGFKFISFAVWHIRKYMTKFLSEHSRQVRLPQNKANSVSKMKQISSDLSQHLGRDATEDEVIEEYTNKMLEEKGNKIKVDDFTLALKADIRPAALELPNDGDDYRRTPIDYINGDTVGTDSGANLETAGNYLMEFVSKLSPVERDIILTKFGFNGGLGEERSWKEIGRVHELSGESIRQKYKKALIKLRKKMNQHGLTADEFV